MDQILNRTQVRDRARVAFEAGRSRESHGMNWHAPALKEWYDEYDRLVNEQKASARREAA